MRTKEFIMDRGFSPEQELMEKKEFWMHVPTTSRGLDEYVERLGLELESLRHKVILDVGSGQGQFAKDVKESGIEAEVYSLDPLFASKEKQEELGKQTRISGDIYKDDKSVAGLGELLPFKDGSFDLVLANYSLPWHADLKEQIADFFSESLRVLKPGGEIRFGPYGISNESPDLAQFLASQLEVLKAKPELEITKDSSNEEGTVTIRKHVLPDASTST